ncbi:MAG: hypothetical protein ACOYNY_38075 [Caldilineaceae bacterium]
MVRITATVEDDIPGLLKELAEGERKQGKCLTDLIRKAHSEMRMQAVRSERTFATVDQIQELLLQINELQEKFKVLETRFEAEVSLNSRSRV